MLSKKNKKFFFIGIGGTGMTPLAILLKKNNYHVAGSDKSNNDNVKTLLSLGVSVFNQHNPKNIHSSDVVVLSSAIKDNNVEKQEAIKLEKKIIHRSDLLKEFINKRNSITIAGTHGKTTTSSLVEHLLNSHEKNSIAILGGISLSYHHYYDLNTCKFFVAEADESDGTFLKYKPSVAIITNIERDHLDYFETYEKIIEHFEKHIANIKKDGILIYNQMDRTCVKLASQFKGAKVSFGLDPTAQIYASNIEKEGTKTTFLLNTPTKKVKSSIKILGNHNILNALSAIALSWALKHNSENTLKALKNFKGIKRRLELIYDGPRLKIYDDYAHNPGKIQASLKALKSHFPNDNLVVLFQPHRFSRMNTMYHNFIESFNDCDLVLVFPTFCAGEKGSSENYSTKKIATDIQRRCHKKTKPVYNVKEALEIIFHEVKKNTIISSLGAGDIGEIAYQLREHLKCKTSLLDKPF